MSKSRSFASLAVGGAFLLLGIGTASAAVYPGVGDDSVGGASGADGPALIIQVGPGGSSIIAGPSVGFPYDGNEDTYIGLENTSGQALFNVSLSGPNIFGFDHDGIGVGPYCTGSCGTVQYGTPNAGDPTGYGGPIGNFTIVDLNNGTFHVPNGLASGDFTWFSLEEPLNLADVTVTGVNGGTTPLPAALPMFAGGLGAFGGLLWRRKRKARAATA